MSDSVLVAAYWGARAETSTEAAGRLHACLQAIAEIDGRLRHWYRRGRLPVATRPIDTTKEGLTRELEAGRHRRDVGGSVMEDLGFSMGGWNGEPHSSAGLDVQCGATTRVPGLTNSFVVDMDAAFDPTIDDVWVERMLDAIAAAWTPDWAVVTTGSIRHTGSAPGARRPLGVATYDSDSRAFEARHLPDFVVSRRVGPGRAVQVTLEPRDEVERRVAQLGSLLGR